MPCEYFKQPQYESFMIGNPCRCFLNVLFLIFDNGLQKGKSK